MPTGVYRRKSGILGGPPVTKTCLHCGKEFTVKNSQKDRIRYCSRECSDASRTERALVAKNCMVCGKEFLSQPYRKVRCCSEDCSKKARAVKTKLNPSGWYKSHDGYIKRSRNYKTEMQHRVFIEQHIGRKLHPWENIHHKNGVKDDNRIENLEIWVTRQPKGQTVKDTVLWCFDFLRAQGYPVDDWIKEVAEFHNSI